MKVERIIVYGAGAAGSNLLMNLVCSHPDLNYTVVDFDKVELRNITAGTQVYSRADINRPKVQALQRIIQTTREKKIDILNKEIRGVSDFAGLGANSLLIDCFDNVKSRNLFVRLPYSVLHVGFSQSLSGEVAWDSVWTPMKESKSDAQIDVCILNRAKAFINGLTGIASLVVSRFIEKGEKINAYFDSNLILKTF